VTLPPLTDPILQALRYWREQGLSYDKIGEEIR